MDIRRGLQILELDRAATPEQVRQAYKDMVNVWHPDRFSHNPRLKTKAEGKLKEINEAYTVVESFLASNSLPRDAEAAANSPARSQQARDQRPEKPAGQAPAAPVDRTEAVVEAGTRLFLTACSYLYKKLASLAAEQIPPSQPGTRSSGEPSPSAGNGCRAERGGHQRRARSQARHCGCGGGPRKG